MVLLIYFFSELNSFSLDDFLHLEKSSMNTSTASSRVFLLMKGLYRFWWGWVNHGRIQIVGWTVLLNESCYDVSDGLSSSWLALLLMTSHDIKRVRGKEPILNHYKHTPQLREKECEGFKITQPHTHQAYFINFFISIDGSLKNL